MLKYKVKIFRSQIMIFNFLNNSDLHELHEEWLVRRTKLSPNTIVTIIDANGDLDQLENQYEAEKSRILNGHLIDDLIGQNVFQ